MSAAGPAAGPGEHIVMENGGTAGVYPDNWHIYPVIGSTRGDLPEGSNGEPWGGRIDIPPE